MLTGRRGRRAVVVYVPLPAIGVFVAGMAGSGIVGGPVHLYVVVTVVAVLGAVRWTTRQGDGFESRAWWRHEQTVTVPDPEQVTTVISVVDGTGSITARVDVARFAPLTSGLTLRRARRTAKVLGARFDDAEWRAWLHARRRRPPTR